MRVLVTGASGFVAQHLVPALAEGHDVVALTHDPKRAPVADSVEPFVCDLRNAADFPAVDAIVHLAQANVPFPDGAHDLFAVNTASTAALLEHAHACGAKVFVHASSASVYGPGQRPWREDDVPAATDFYSATKVASERLVAAYASSLAGVSLRLVAPYGPGQANRLIPRLIDRVEARDPIVLNSGGRPRMNPIYIDDVVALVARLLDGHTRGIVNVGGDDAVGIRELGEAIGRIVGVDPVFVDGDAVVDGDLVVENRVLRTLLGRPPLALEEGLARTVSMLTRHA